MENTNILAFIGGLGGTEVFIILFAVLLLFGAKRIPELAKGLGRGIREFKDATSEIKGEMEKSEKGDKAAVGKLSAKDGSQEKAAL